MLRFASSYTADFSFIYLSFFALKSPSNILKALSFSWLFLLLNPVIAVSSPYSNLLRYAILLSSLFTILRFSRTLILNSLITVTAFLSLFLLFHSVFFSPLPILSLLKSLSWVVTVFVLFQSVSIMSEDSVRRLWKWLYFFLLSICFASFPLLLYPEIGYQVNNNGFQGILNHPQAYGIISALLCSLSLGCYLHSSYLKNLYLALAFFSFLATYLSESRTALFSVVLGLLSSIFFFAFSKPFLSSIRRFILNSYFLLFSISSLLLIFIYSDYLIDLVNQFLLKRDALYFTSFLDLYKHSRAVLFEPMLDNIHSNFYQGIGFGLPSIPDTTVISYDPILNLPIAAPVEKGNFVLAFFEELGIPGLFFLMYWTIVLLIRSYCNGFICFNVVITVLLLNLSESFIMSAGGLGPLVLTLIALSTSRYNISKVLHT